ncbi:hypothetical protein KSP39_PZI017893 [Platanthera zijinensis]|uniref:SAM domain-containing protein n=1 Tax=Platanthera zijinensis TaxID=2320716 RepID=A0AAP0B6E0_9ASPA
MDDLPSFNCDRGEEEEGNIDEWVVVKKQRFTILIPPPSPPAQQIMMEMRAKPSTSQQPNAAYPIAKKGRANGNKNRPSSSSRAYGHGVGSMGAVNVVNLRMRAMNLERKLGGLPALLGATDHRFMAAVLLLESKKLSQYQLANLTTSKLKDMGMNTVGHRRKLIHAIDLLCRPYYYTSAPGIP